MDFTAGDLIVVKSHYKCLLEHLTIAPRLNETLHDRRKVLQKC